MNRKSLRKMKYNKSAGEDGFTTEVLRMGEPPLILRIINIKKGGHG